jgi:hypothetical protein
MLLGGNMPCGEKMVFTANNADNEQIHPDLSTLNLIQM